jgi:hypothetical protein
VLDRTGLLFVVLGVLVASGCARSGSEPQVTLAFDCNELAALDERGRAMLERYLAQSDAWDVREDASGGARHAVRVGDVDAGSGLHGYLTVEGSDARRQHRTLVNLGERPPGTTGHPGTVFAEADGRPTIVLLRPSSDDGRVATSNVRISGGAGVWVELFEEGPAHDRALTASSFSEVCDDLRAALDGRTPPTASGSAPEMEVLDGMQPGIYRVRALLNPGAPGSVEVRVFEDGTHGPLPDEVVRGAALSTERIRDRSLRRVGWSDDSSQRFRYDAEITVYEGDWGDPYDARFELWFSPDEGSARKLTELRRTIEGWMR